MDTGVIVVIVVVALVLLAVLVLVARRGRERRHETRRVEAGEMRREAEVHDARAQGASAEADESGARARREEAAAREQTVRAEEHGEKAEERHRRARRRYPQRFSGLSRSESAVFAPPGPTAPYSYARPSHLNPSAIRPRCSIATTAAVPPARSGSCGCPAASEYAPRTLRGCR